MITGILIILTFTVNFILIVLIRKEQESNYKSLYKHPQRMWDHVIQIRRTVREIDRKIDLNEHLKKD